MVIRPFAEADVPGILAIEQACAEFPWSENQFLSSVAAGHYCGQLEVDGEIIGFSIFSLVVDEACLLDIAVLPRYQGRGYGRQLLSQGLAQMQALGASSCYLEVRVSNLSAQALYKSMGFEVVGERKDYYPARDGRENGWVMSRQLPVSPAAEV